MMLLFGEVGFLVLIGRCMGRPKSSAVAGLPMSGAPNGAPEGVDVLPKLGCFLWKELLVDASSKEAINNMFFNLC